MFLESPASRATHVVRLFGTNRNGDVIQSMYADVERIDDMYNVVSSDSYVDPNSPLAQVMGQGFVRLFRWRDDPAFDDYLEDGNPNKETGILKLCDPRVKNQNFDDPDEWIPLRKINKISALMSRYNYQKLVEKFLNEELHLSREVEYRRIYHYDTSIDERAEEAADADPTLKAWVIDLSGDNKHDYELLDETKDTTNYIEYELITKLGHENLSGFQRGSSSDRVIKLLNEYLMDISVDALMQELGSDSINPPYVLDPYQNIVNINWGGLAVQFYDRAGSR